MHGLEAQGYLVDGCIHWLCGSGPGMSIHRLWQELGPAKDIRFVDHEALSRIELPEMDFMFYADPDRLEEYLVDLGPEDEAVVHELTQAIRDFVRHEALMQADWLHLEVDPARVEEFGQFMHKWNTTTMGYFTERLRSPKLQRIFSVLTGSWIPVFFFLLPLALCQPEIVRLPHRRFAGFARSIERRYLALGGEIEYEARVKRILVEDGSGAVGLLLEDGREIRGEDVTVISAADLHATMFDMLEGRFQTDKSRAWFDKSAGDQFAAAGDGGGGDEGGGDAFDDFGRAVQAGLAGGPLRAPAGDDRYPGLQLRSNRRAGG